MPGINLRYGRTLIPFDYDLEGFEILGEIDSRGPLSDVEIGAKLDHPINSPTLEEIVNPGDTVLIVVSDATRQTGAGQIVNLLVRRLIANGTEAFNIRIIFATGIHRPVTEAEKNAILTPFIAKRIKTLNHDPRDLARLRRVGEINNGISVELNSAIFEHEHVILVGGISFHYFAGFTGGRKLICPGLASRQTISATHKLAFDCERLDRREGVGTARLDGNPVHAAFVEAASKANISFSVNTVVNDAGEVTDLYCGDWIESHRVACDAFAAEHTISISERRDVVITSCGGFPHDINMIQAHKTLEAASHVCRDGGMIILLAECSDGLGRDDFLNWFAAADSSELARRLCEGYQVNGQTAWSLLRKAERFDVRLISNLSAQTAEAMRLTLMQSLTRTLAKAKPESKGYILPSGSKVNIVSN